MIEMFFRFVFMCGRTVERCVVGRGSCRRQRGGLGTNATEDSRGVRGRWWEVGALFWPYGEGNSSEETDFNEGNEIEGGGR